MSIQVWRLVCGLLVTNVILVSATAALTPDLLGLMSITYGFAGSALLTIPFFRDHRARRIYNILRQASLRAGDATPIFERAAQKKKQRVSEIRPSWTDFYLALAGILCLFASYVVSLLDWILMP